MAPPAVFRKGYSIATWPKQAPPWIARPCSGWPRGSAPESVPSSYSDALATDNGCSDGSALELSTITGSVAIGLTSTISVAV